MPPALREFPEVVEPEARVELTGIVFDERELDPSHRSIEPVGALNGRLGRRGLSAVRDHVGDRRERAAGRDLQELAA
jgi:hypothetical protein